MVGMGTMNPVLYSSMENKLLGRRNGVEKKALGYPLLSVAPAVEI